MAKIPPEAHTFAAEIQKVMPDHKVEGQALFVQGFLSQQIGVRIGPKEGPARYLVQRGTMFIHVVDCTEGQPNKLVSRWFTPRNQGWRPKAAVQVRDVIAQWENVVTGEKTP